MPRPPARSGVEKRHSFLVQSLFDGCFRISEAIDLIPNSLIQTQPESTS